MVGMCRLIVVFFYSDLLIHDILLRGLIGGVLALKSFQQYFGLDKLSPGQHASLNGNIVSILQAGSL